MIVLRLQGGLGNQMFQWSCARNLAVERNCEIILDISSYIYDKKRHFQLGNFEAIKGLINRGHVSVLSQPIRYPLTTILDDFKTFSFPSTSLYLNGYWQSELFFKNNKNIIFDDFDLSNFQYIHDKYKNIGEYISLHIRRTDYVTSSGYHPVLSMEYYDRALSYLDNDYNIFVFSDDIAWCKNNLKWKKTHFVEDCNEFESLWLMSHAKHNIVANSSFSWWGAWLNVNEDKKVFAPKVWFGDISHLNTENLVPQNWIKI